MTLVLVCSRVTRAAVTVAAAGALSTLACGCSGHKTIDVPANKPPPANAWPAYPTFSAHSCWTRHEGGNRAIRVMRAAPSVKPKRSVRVPTPGQIVRRLLARLGDRRYIRRIDIGAPPQITLAHLHGYYGGARPPADARWAYIQAPEAAWPGSRPKPNQIGTTMVAHWETELVAGALRDDFCAAGGSPLVGASTNELVSGISSGIFALMQRFPNPSPEAFRRRVDTIGRRFGFHVVSLRLLRPRQIAPLLVVETSRDRKGFVHDVPAIMSSLDPTNAGADLNATTFEGFLLEARDARGPFVRVENVNRGEAGGGQWSWNRCVYPYGHSEPVTAKPCP
jgi:hypothetical protein